MKNEDKKCLITIREINSNKANKSLGVTFPVELAKKTGMSSGKYICEYEKINGKWKVSFILNSIWEGKDE